MIHSSTVINVQKVSDGIIAVKIRCCGDPSTDSVLSVHELHRPDEEIQKDVEEHRARVEQLHQQAQRAEELINKFRK